MSTLPRFSHDHSILSEFRFENNWRSDWTPVSVLKNDMGEGVGQISTHTLIVFPWLGAYIVLVEPPIAKILYNKLLSGYFALGKFHLQLGAPHMPLQIYSLVTQQNLRPWLNVFFCAMLIQQRRKQSVTTFTSLDLHSPILAIQVARQTRLPAPVV